MDLNYVGYLLFVIPGFCLVWSYRHFTKAGKIGEFEYAIWSSVWGAMLFFAFALLIKLGHINEPPIPLNNPFALLGGLMGMSFSYAFGAAFTIGYTGAYLSRLGLFNWIDEKLFWILETWVEKTKQQNLKKPEKIEAIHPIIQPIDRNKKVS